MRRGAVTVAGLVLLAGCSAATTEKRPSVAVEYPWQGIAAQDSELAISGPQDHRHRAHKNGGRYQESVSFANGASVFYEQLEGHRFTFGVSGSDIIKSWYKGKSVQEAGFAFKDNAVRRNAEAFAATDSGTSRTCSLYARVFGTTEAGSGNGDQLYLIQYCLPSGPDAAAGTERVVAEIAARLQATPIFAKPLPKLALTPETASIGANPTPQAPAEPAVAAPVPAAARALPAGQRIVPLEKIGATYQVPVVINGTLTLKFILDSGASEVSIPADVVLTLMRAGTIADSDFLDARTYVLADGTRLPSRRFRIRSPKVGDIELGDVTGSIAPDKGSLLLGQSFLGRFDSWAIDNKRNALLID